MTSIASPAVLQIEDYSLQYATSGEPLKVLKNVNIVIERGEIFGLVGESGSGKSSLGWSIMRYLPRSAVSTSGRILLNGEDLAPLCDRDMDLIRGKRIGMVFQDPGTSLNPTLSLGSQVAEVLTRHRGLSGKQAWAEAEAMLARVGFRAPRAMMARMPHEVSGGEKQRVVIATAFACNPDCIVLDEPTTALDVITARQILDLLLELQAETGVAALYISHDLALVSRTAKNVAVISRGEILEQGLASSVFSTPSSDYTRHLIAAVPDPRHRLRPLGALARKPPLMTVENVTVRYGRQPIVARLLGRKYEQVSGNRAINLTIQPGEILGIVGESGSGKSTLAKAITGLNKFEGIVSFDGRPVTGVRDMTADYRRDVQIIFQHPDASLNPRQKVREILSRPFKLYSELSDRADEQIGDLLEKVRLPRSYIDKYPHEMSGGEKQRVAIARAFASTPKLVICDEITSALDVSVQASIVKLLIELQQASGAAYMFITHDLNLVRQIADRIAVMYRGDLLEVVPAESIDSPERAEYTQRLIKAVPLPAGT